MVALSSGKDKKKKTPQKEESATTTTTEESSTKKQAPKGDPIEEKLLADKDLIKASLKSSSGLARGLKYNYYEGNYGKLADMLKTKPKSKGDYKTFSLDIKKKNSQFGFTYEGYINIPKTREYTFRLISDDGSRLTIAGKVIIDHDGHHGIEPKEGKAKLEKGLHKFRLDYFQHGKSFALDLKASASDKEMETIRYTWFWFKK